MACIVQCTSESEEQVSDLVVRLLGLAIPDQLHHKGPVFTILTSVIYY
jgi:hypothetical protein